jgi:rhamnosyltransferase subunit B
VHSPELVIGLFPEWFCPPPPDWPPQVRLTGFPLWDEREIEAMAGEVYDFVNAPGGAPIVFTPGSANHHAHDLFAAAVDACRRLGVRGMLLSRYREHVPANLPDTIRHVDYAPFSELFPLAAAVVHHGGIGTSAQALAAGTRQLITPMAHDQFDNAARLVKLEVARSLPARRVTGRRLARELKALLEDRAYHVRCHWVSQWFKGQQALVDTAKLLEEFAREKLDTSRVADGSHSTPVAATPASPPRQPRVLQGGDAGSPPAPREPAATGTSAEHV